MNDVEQRAKGQDTGGEALVVRRVMVCSGILLLLLTVGSWWFWGRSLAQSVLIGGLLVNGSFWLLKKDAQRLMQRVGEEDVPSGAVVNMEKTRFFLRALARFVVLGLLLFVLASQVTINVVGLTLGFGTVMVSVVIIGLGTGKCCLPSKV